MDGNLLQELKKLVEIATTFSSSYVTHGKGRIIMRLIINIPP